MKWEQAGSESTHLCIRSNAKKKKKISGSANASRVI